MNSILDILRGPALGVVVMIFALAGVIVITAFAALVAQGALAEWAEVHGQRYGTLRETVEVALRAGRIALFDIDVQGGAQLRRAFPRESATVFIVPPSVAELERRLRGRSTDSEDVIARRLAVARAEVAEGIASYDYVIVNDDLDAALARLEAIAAHERARRAGRADPAAEVLATRSRAGAVDVRAWTHQG